jgi:protein-S-isoprenylcysteine O-methyltransferase Ste14
MKLHRLMAASLALAFMSAAALAQTAPAIDPGVHVPLGEWVQGIGTILIPLLGAASLWLIRKLPAQIAGILMSARADQILEKAVTYAINSVAGAAKDKQLTFTTGSQVVNEAVQYVVDHGPGWLINWLGGPEMIREKIIARIDVAPEVSLK